MLEACRYELGNFAQYITKMVGVLENGDFVVLEKENHHLWRVPSGIRKIAWAFHADILNAGSTFVRDDIHYVNPVNCMLYEVGAESTDTKYAFATFLLIGSLLLHSILYISGIM